MRAATRTNAKHLTNSTYFSRRGLVVALYMRKSQVRVVRIRDGSVDGVSEGQGRRYHKGFQKITTRDSSGILAEKT